MNAADLTTSAYGRDACPVCGRDIALTKDGTMRAHKVKVTSEWPRNCEGSGQRPKSEA